MLCNRSRKRLQKSQNFRMMSDDDFLNSLLAPQETRPLKLATPETKAVLSGTPSDQIDTTSVPWSLTVEQQKQPRWGCSRGSRNSTLSSPTLQHFSSAKTAAENRHCSKLSPTPAGSRFGEEGETVRSINSVWSRKSNWPSNVSTFQARTARRILLPRQILRSVHQFV